MWELEQKYYFILLLLIPLIGLLFIWNLKWRKKAIERFGSVSALERLAPEISKRKNLLKTILFAIIVFFLTFALVNPKIGTELETVKRQGIDIVFAIDVSKSMLAEDIAPSRMAKAKQLATQIINHLSSDRVGVVGYAGTAFPLLPITTDYSLAKMYIQDLNTDMVSSMGTALSNAIEMGSNYFDDPKTSKLMILISDGEDHEENIQEAIKIAQDKGIKIITIGVGTEAGGQIPIKENGRIVSYKQDFDGMNVVTKLNKETLEDIAKSTGGTFIYGSNTNEVVNLIEKNVEKIEKTDFESQQVSDFQSQFQWFIVIALVVLLLDTFVFERKTSWLQRWNLFNEK